MPKRAKNSFKISVEGLSHLAAVPGWLDEGQRRFLRIGVGRLRDSIASKAPGGPGGSVGRSFEVETISSTAAAIESRHPGAKALDQGAYIKPRAGHALRFRVGGAVVFTRRPVRLTATKYVAKGLRPRAKIIREAYAEAFGNLEQYGGGTG